MAHYRCTCKLDDIGNWNETVFTDDQRKRSTFLQLNIYGAYSDESSADGMTSITSWTLKGMESNSYGCVSETHFEHDEKQRGC